MPERKKEPSVRVVLLNGGELAGKRTFCEMVADALPDAVVSSVRVADPVREWLRKPPMNWRPETPENDRDRRLVQIVMGAWQNYDDGPFRLALEHAERSTIGCLGKCLVIVHAREGYMIARFLEHFRLNWPGTRPVSVLIDRPGIDSGGFAGFFGHDWLVHNRGTLEDLRREAEKFVKWMGLGDGEDD